MDTPDDCLYKAQSALSCLRYFSDYLQQEPGTLPPSFGSGLSVILGYIETDVTSAYEGLNTKNGEKQQ